MPHPSFVVVVPPPAVLGKGVQVVTIDGGSQYFPERNFVISGITKDSTGAAMAGATVKLFNTATDTVVQTAVSDATGAYAFAVDKTLAFYAVAYMVMAPDTAGTTVNTLRGV